MSNKNVKLKLNTRFIVAIDKNFENVYLKDLGCIEDKLTSIECSEILKDNLEEIITIAGSIENKLKENERIKNKEHTFRKLTVIK